MGPGGYGYSGHVGKYEQGESVCTGYCGLCIKVDRGLPDPQQNGGSCGIFPADHLSVRNAGCDTFRSRLGVREPSDERTVPFAGGS